MSSLKKRRSYSKCRGERSKVESAVEYGEVEGGPGKGVNSNQFRKRVGHSNLLAPLAVLTPVWISEI